MFGDKLDSEVREYLDDHAVRKHVSTTYTLGATTLKRTPSKVLVFHSKVSPAGAYVGYNSYASLAFQRSAEQFKVKDKDHHRSFFKVFEK